MLDARSEDLLSFPSWVGCVSATSVYPDMPKHIFYEDTSTSPATARGKARVFAKARWQKQHQAEIFGLAGIYGPGRSPFDAHQSGTTQIIKREGQVFNRIHVDDICRIIIAAIEWPRQKRLINLADHKPAPQGDVIRYAAKLIGVKSPIPQKLETANLSATARSFYVSRRRIGSLVIKQELSIDLLYPDYEKGLTTILASEHQLIDGSSDPLA